MVYRIASFQMTFSDVQGLYRQGQHCAQRKAPVYKLLRGRFWGFSPHRGNTLHRWEWNLARRSEPKVHSSVPDFTPIRATIRVGIGTPKLKFLLRFDQNSEYKRHTGRIPCAIFTKFAQFVPRFRLRELLKFGWICWRGYGVMGVLS